MLKYCRDKLTHINPLKSTFQEGGSQGKFDYFINFLKEN